jgi:hypothetical protein
MGNRLTGEGTFPQASQTERFLPIGANGMGLRRQQLMMNLSLH